MHKRLSSFVGMKIGVSVLLLAMTCANARGDADDDRETKFLQSHPGFHGFLTPHPPYPLRAKMSHIEGKVQVRVDFAAKGNVEKVEILQSSGSPILDSNTSLYIRRYWRNLSGKQATHTLMMDYFLH